MKIAIISDTHDNLANLEIFLKLVKEEGVGGLVHCGDVTTPETLSWLANNFSGPIKVADGNAEIRSEEFINIVSRHKNLEVFSELGEWEIGGLKIAFTHRPDRTKELASSGLYNYVFYGHTHKPWIDQVGEVLIANPGTLGGVFTAPTFALLDTATGRLELKRLF